MIIGFDASRAFIKDRTGTENYSFQLLKALARIDTKNKDLLRNSVGKILPRPRRTLRFADAKRIYLIYIRPGQERLVNREEWPENFQFRIINFKYLWTQVGLAIKTFTDPLDVLFVPSHTLPILRKPGLKTVITVHDLGAEYLPAFHQLKQVLYLKLMTHFQLKGATKIIAVSEATKLDLVNKIGIEKEKVEVVYEGVDKEAFSYQPACRTGRLSAISQVKIDDILRRYGIERNSYFLFVGTIQPRKNLERLIKAFATFARGPAATVSYRPSSPSTPLRVRARRQETSSASPLAGYITNFQLVLVGGGGWKSEHIYNLPKELGIEIKVKFLGRVEDNALAALYSGAIALVFPSLFEGFGLPILEAFACGCPVITSNTSSMPEVAGDAALLVNPESTEEIKEGMVRIIKDDKFRDILIQKGHSRIKNFSWEKTARETLNVFKDI